MSEQAAGAQINAPVVPPQPQKHPAGNSPIIASKAQSVADAIEAKQFGPAASEDEPAAKQKPEGKPAEKQAGQEQPAAKPAEGQKPADGAAKAEAQPDGQDDVQKLIDARKGKPPADKVEKRKETIQAEIDQLTAQKKSLAEEVAKLNTQKDGQQAQAEKQAAADKKDEFPEYSDDELGAALQKAFEEQDFALFAEIDKYKAERLERRLTKKYQEAEKGKTKQQEERDTEWNQITGKFTPAAYQNDAIKNDPDFNVADAKSLLFRLAKGLFEDPELKAVYAGPGGMTRATQDAFNQLLLDRTTTGFKTGGGNPKQNGSLQNQLEKEKRKNALGAGAEAASEGNQSGAQSSGNDLDDYINERRKMKSAGMRGTQII